MRKQAPNWTSALAPFCQATLDCLGRNEARDNSFVLGGTSEDGSIGWLARGNALEVFSGTTGERLAAWCFGNIVREPSTYITCICAYDCDNGSKLVVATSCETSRMGMLCLFCINSSKVIRAIEVPYRVTALEPVCVSGQVEDVPTFGEQLKSFCGILAVGTEGGHTFLVDMCLDDEMMDGSELQLNEMYFISARTSDIATVRYSARSCRQNLTLELGEDTQTKGWFLYRRPDSSVLKKYGADQVIVSSIKYMPRTGMLAVGFNFGCFQLWRLNVPVLEYSSRFEDHLAPVSNFAYQEPENDPRYFCYLWVGRGPLPQNDTDEYASSIMLFQLEFDKKTWYDSLGHVFEELTSVGPRFEHELSGDVKSPLEGSSSQNFGSRIIACCGLVDPHAVAGRDSNEQSFDEGGASSMRLCMFAWEVQTLEQQCQRSCVLGIFDMNRWYHAQMPVSIRFGASHEECPFFAFCSLDSVMAASNSEAVVTAHVPYMSITKFSSAAHPSTDQHTYPSTLSFDVYGVSESGIVRSKFLGLQRQILADVQRGGTGVLVDPTELYNRCLSATLLPQHMDISSSAVSLIGKREAILSVALDHNLIGFITSCIAQSASSSDYVGTLRLVMEWAWHTVTKIKESLDRICEPLHDWSGLQLDVESLQKLLHHNVALMHLVTIFQTLAAHSATTTEQGRQELETKLAVLILIQQHVSVVVWFLSAGLLPEYPEDRESSTDQFVYAATRLQDTYKQRRRVIMQLPSEVRSTDILLIDGLVAAVGSSLGDLWVKDGSSTPNYPPPSLHALLNMYLLEDVTLMRKHHVTFYVLCDIYSTLPDDLQVCFGDRLQQFGQQFGLPPGITRLVQGFWLLDHGDFEDSLSYFLDPLVTTDQLLPWQHTRIIKSLLYQGESRLALRYVRVKTPPMLTRGDIKLQLTVLLANGLISEAFEFQRSCRDKASAEDLLSHLFRGAQQTKTVDKLLQLPFTEEEECDLVRYLQSSEDQHAQELLVLYYLQRARFVEAVRLNDVLKKSDQAIGETAVARASMRNAIVDGYLRVLPGVQRRLSASLNGSRPVLINKYKFARPAPLSTVVHRSLKMKAITQATLINSVLNKVHEVRITETEEDTDDEDMPRRRTDSEEMEIVPDPFVGTPLTPRATRRSHTVNEIMFGTSNESSLRLMSPGSVSKRRLTSNLDVGVSTGSPRISRSYAADAISLLQTPPVRRRSVALRGVTSSHKQPEFVPQSIIKTKSTEKKPKRVNMFVDVADSGRSGVKWPTMPELPTPPRTLCHKEVTKVLETVSTGSVTAHFECTPKQLRFAEPANEQSTSESMEEESCSSTAAPRVSFQHAVEHTNAIRLQQREKLPVSDSPTPTDEKEESEEEEEEDEEEEKPTTTYVEVDSDITFNFPTTNLTTGQYMHMTEGRAERSVSFTSATSSPRNLSNDSRLRSSQGRQGSESPDENSDSTEGMDVEDEGSDMEEGSDRTSDFLSPLCLERSPALSVEHEALQRSDSLVGSGERIIITPTPRLPLRYTPEQSRQSPYMLDDVSVGGDDVGVTGQVVSSVSHRESKVTAQATLSELRQSGTVSLDAGDTASPVSMLSVTRCVTRSKEVRESVSSHRVVNSSGLQSLSVDLLTPPRPTRVSNLPLTPPLSRSPLRSHSLQQTASQPSPLAPRSTRSTSAVVASPGQSRPSASPIMTRATSHSVSPSVAVGRSDSPVQQASSSRQSPSPPRQSPLRESPSPPRQSPSPSRQSPSRESPSKQSQSPPRQSPSPSRESPSRESPLKQSPSRESPSKQSPSRESPSKQSPSRQSPSSSRQSSLRHSPSPDQSLSHSPQVTGRPSIRTESPLAASAATTMLDSSESETDDAVAMETTESSAVRFSTDKVNRSSVTRSVKSAVDVTSVGVRVSSSSHVTRTHSESSSLRPRATSIESLETTLNIPKSATKAFRSSRKNQPPLVPKSASKSAVKSALKLTAKSRKQHIEEEVEQTEDTESHTHGSNGGPLSGESFMMRLRTRPNSESRNSPDKTVTMKEVSRVDETFTFSAPSRVTREEVTASKGDETTVSSTPIQPFIFSPPITRTRTRGHRKEAPTPLSLLDPEVVALSPARNTRLASKRTQKQKEDKKKVQHSVMDISASDTASDSVINFVSPVASTEESGPRRRGKLVHPAGYSMTLRQKTSGKTKRKPLKW